MLLTNVALLVAAFASPPPGPVADILAHRVTIPIVSVAPLAHGILAWHTDRSGTYVELDGGDLLLGILDEDGTQGTGPLPAITTTWKDKDGMTHSVTVPVVGTTEAALKRAIETHQKLVAAMQALYPPYKG